MEYETWLYNMLKNYDPGTRFDMEAAHMLTKKISNNILVSNNIDLSSQKSLERYNKFIKLVISKNPKEYLINEFEVIDEKDAINIFKEIMFMFLGKNKDIESLLNEFSNHIVISNETNNPMDGRVLELLNKLDNSIMYGIRLPNTNTISSIVCMCHEFMHLYSIINKLDYNKKSYYEEILSIFAEKYASTVLEGQGSIDLIKKIENIRLEVIKFHYTERPNDVEATRLFAEQHNDDYLFKFYKEYKRYSKFVAEAYGLGYLYGEALLQLYLNDNGFKNDFINVINKKISLQEILDKYNINLNNKEIIEQSKKKIRTIFK